MGRRMAYTSHVLKHTGELEVRTAAQLNTHYISVCMCAYVHACTCVRMTEYGVKRKVHNQTFLVKVKH